MQFFFHTIHDGKEANDADFDADNVAFDHGRAETREECITGVSAMLDKLRRTIAKSPFSADLAYVDSLLSVAGSDPSSS